MSSPLRVLQIITELAPAGAESIVRTLAAGLAARGLHVRLVGLFDPPWPGPDIGHQLVRVGLDVTRLAMRHKLDLLRLIRLVRLVRQWQPHIIHAHLWHADMASRLARLLAWPHRPIILSTIHIAEHRRLPWRFALERLTQSLCDAVACVSPSVMHFHRRRIGGRRSRRCVIPNGIDLSRFARLPPRIQARKTYCIPATCKAVGTVARLDVQKNIALLLEAFARLAGRFPDAVLLIAGRGPQEPILRARAHSLGIADRTHFVGFQPDPLPLLASLDVFVLPSRWEGFGLATLEAMAAAVPVIVTDVIGSRDLVQPGRTGLLVPPDDAPALASAIQQLWTNPQQAAALAKAARRAARRYDQQTMVRRYLQLYHELVSGPASRRRCFACDRPARSVARHSGDQPSY
ncbi:MAG: glycosyltransferase [Phycisphaerae bacterium]